MTVLRSFLTVLIYGMFFAELAFSDALSRQNGNLVYVILALLLLRTATRGYSDSLQIVLSVTLIFIFVVPAAAIYIILGTDVLSLLFIFTLFSDLLLAMSRGSEPWLKSRQVNPIPHRQRSDILLLFFLLFWCAASWSFMPQTGLIGALSFTIPFGISLAILDSVLSHRNRLFQTLLFLFAYTLTITSFLLFRWDGFGRLAVGSLILAPLLVANARTDLGIRPYYVILFSLPALYLAQSSRYGTIEQMEDMFIGSAGHHLLVSHDILERHGFWLDGGVETFFLQYALFFFNWFPRELWPNKPFGVGLWSVDVIYGREGLGEGYSQSVGFIGEQYFYLGDFYWLGLLVMLATLYLVRSFIKRFSFGSSAPLIIFDVNLISYFWGGGATFGSRTWFMLIPAIIACWMIQRRRSVGEKSTPPLADT